MGIRLHPKDNPTCYRVYRAWGGKDYQRYVPLDGTPKKAYSQAVDVDNKLKEGQNAYKLRMQLTRNSLLHANGTIIGLTRVLYSHKQRPATDIFKCRVKIPGKVKIHFATVSIDFHGFDHAASLIINKICEWRGIKPSSEEYELLVRSMNLYRD